MHRVVRILEERAATLYVLRGDALTDDDAPVRGCKLLGRVTSIERRGKSLELKGTMGVKRRALRLIVRHSKTAAALLLGWQAIQERYFDRDEKLLAASGKTKTECT